MNPGAGKSISHGLLNSFSSSAVLGSLVLLTGCMQPGDPLPVRDGLVAEYLFDGNARDTSVNEQDGQVLEARLTTDRFGQPSAAYEFRGGSINGPGDYIDCGRELGQRLTDAISVSCWVKPHTRQPDFSRILGRYDNDLRGGFRLSYSGTFAFGVASDGSDHDLTAEGDYAPGTWHHVVGTYDVRAGVLKLYVNGLLVAEKRGYHSGQLHYTAREWPACERFSIGCYWAWGVSYFQGVIDDVRVYNRPLTPGEVTRLYSPMPVFLSGDPAMHSPLRKRNLSSESHQFSSPTGTREWPQIPRDIGDTRTGYGACD